MKSWRKQRPGWPGTESAVCEGGRSSGQGVPARALADQLADPQEHKARWHQPRTGPKSRSWIFKPHTRPNSTPIKVNKSLPLITAVAGSGPYWCLLEARYKSDYFYTVTHQILIHSIIYGLANKQEILITQSYRLHLHPWLAWWELREGFEYVLHRAAVHRTCRMQ